MTLPYISNLSLQYTTTRQLYPMIHLKGLFIIKTLDQQETSHLIFLSCYFNHEPKSQVLQMFMDVYGLLCIKLYAL